MAPIDTLRVAAREARGRAYVPYSDFAVGAALEADDGSIHVGCNVENVSFGLTLCAERVAVMGAVAAGHRRFRRLVVSTRGREPVAPCGACRQVLWEFAPELRVEWDGDGEAAGWRLSELLPHPFGPRAGEGGASLGIEKERGT